MPKTTFKCKTNLSFRDRWKKNNQNISVGNEEVEYLCFYVFPLIAIKEWNLSTADYIISETKDVILIHIN